MTQDLNFHSLKNMYIFLIVILFVSASENVLIINSFFYISVTIAPQYIFKMYIYISPNNFSSLKFNEKLHGMRNQYIKIMFV